MAEDSPTRTNSVNATPDIESGKLPARRKAALKTKASGLLRRAPLRPETPPRRKTPLRARRKETNSWPEH